MVGVLASPGRFKEAPNHTGPLGEAGPRLGRSLCCEKARPLTRSWRK